MWYDRYPGVPPRGSQLETLFLFVFIQRKESELLETRALVRGQWATLVKSPEAAKASFEAYQNYAEAMFPFLEAAANTSTTDQQRLLQHVLHPMQIDVSSLRHERAEAARAKGLRKFRLMRKDP